MSKPTKRNACKDCKHFYREYYTYGDSGPARCLHPAFFAPIDDDGVPAEYARLESPKCGPSGKLWEPIPLSEKPAGQFGIFWAGFTSVFVLAAIYIYGH